MRQQNDGDQDADLLFEKKKFYRIRQLVKARHTPFLGGVGKGGDFKESCKIQSIPQGECFFNIK